MEQKRTYHKLGGGKTQDVDVYLTIKYLLNTDKLYFYNHGGKIGSISLAGKDFNVRDMIEDLRGKNEPAYRRDGEPTNGVLFFKTYNTPLSDKRIRLNYNCTYPNIKIAPIADSSIEPHLAAYTVSTTNLVGHWDASNLNNAGNSADSSDTATTWTDRSGSANNGTLTNFTLPTGGTASGWDGANTPANPSVLKFDGTNDYVSVNSLTTALANATTGTISLWTKKPSDDGTEAILFSFSNNSSATLTEVFVDIDAATGRDYFSFACRTDGTEHWNFNTGADSLGAHFGNWVNIVLVHNGTEPILYLNGTQTSQTYTTATNKTKWFKAVLTDATTDANVGSIGVLRRNGTLVVPYAGHFSNVRIYSSALSAEQIRTNYLAEAYKFQGTDSVAPGIYGEEDLRTSTYKKSGDTFDVYVEDVNPVANGDSDVNGINSLTCMLGSTSLTTPSATEQNFTGGLTFDGSNDYVSLPNLGTGIQSVSVLIKPSSTTTNILELNGTTSISASAGTISATGFTSPTIYVNGAVSSTLTASTWQLVTVTTGTGISGSAANIGKISASYFNGQIANVQIYNRALTSSEIARNNRARYEPSDPTGLVAWYKLDEGSGTTAAARKWNTSTNAIVTDTSLDGTLTNGPTYTNQYSYNRNKYTFSVPTLTGANQVEKLQCTATDAWSNSTTTNEEVGGVFVTRANPTVSTNVTANSTIMTGDTIAVTVTDNTPDSSILSSPTTPTANIDGNSFSTTCSITPTTVTKAETFDGVDDYVNIANSSSLIPTNNLTVSFWFKANNISSTQALVMKHRQTSSPVSGWNTALSAVTAGKVMWQLRAGNTCCQTLENTNALNSNTWYHFVGTYDGAKSSIYINGALDNSLAVTGNLEGNERIQIGRDPNSDYSGGSQLFFGGNIDDLQIYNRTLSPNEISYLYNNPSKIFNGNGLAGWWRFDQLEDTNSNSVVDNIRDYSSNSNHGTLTNYASLSSALVDSTVTGSIDGRTGSCNIEITNSNPSGPINHTNKTLTTSATNAISLTGSETKTVSLSRNLAPTTPRVSSAMLNNDSLSNDLTVFNTEHGDLLVVNFTASDSDGSDTITLSTVTTPSIGRFEAMSGNPASATFTYSPSYGDSGMAYTFSVRASDGTANSASDLSITVNAPRGYPYAPPAIQAPSTTEVKSENKPTIVVVIPPTKPNDETAGGRPSEPAMGEPSEPAMGQPGDSNEPKKPEVSIPFIEAAFPEVPNFEQLPEEKPGKDKPTQTNVILAGSENTFAIPGNSDAAKELRDKPPSEVEVLVTIVDSAGKKVIIPATVLVAAGKNDNSPVVINTEQIPENLAEGQAIIELLINGVPKAQINVVISKSQLRSESELVNDLNKPFILSVKAIRKGEFLKVLITGSNFFDKELNVNGIPIETTEKLTEISMLPNNGIERVQMKIKSKNLIVATYMIKDKKKIGRNLVVTVTNPYGRAVSTFEVPKR